MLILAVAYWIAVIGWTVNLAAQWWVPFNGIIWAFVGFPVGAIGTILAILAYDEVQGRK